MCPGFPGVVLLGFRPRVGWFSVEQLCLQSAPKGFDDSFVVVPDRPHRWYESGSFGAVGKRLGRELHAVSE